MSLKKALVHLYVCPRIEEEAVALEAVTARPPDLLVPGLDVLRHVPMDDEADIRLVDAHSEGDGRHDHVDLVALERFLVSLAVLGREPGMVGQRVHSVRLQEVRGLLHAFRLRQYTIPLSPFRRLISERISFLCIPGPLLPAADLEVGRKNEPL